MGSKSTVDIPREEALRIINVFLETASDEAVSDVLEVLNDDQEDHPDYQGHYNFQVMP